ncbi:MULTISPECIES: type II toxin-antitoxin system RelE family toxin [Aphanothece]
MMRCSLRYRVVYEWQQQELVALVVRVGHRHDVYR